MTIDVRFTSGARATVEAPSVMAVRRKLATGADVVKGNDVSRLRAALTIDASKQAGHPCVIVALESTATADATQAATDDCKRMVREARARFAAHLRAAGRTGASVRSSMIPGVQYLSRWPTTGTKVRMAKREADGEHRMFADRLPHADVGPGVRSGCVLSGERRRCATCHCNVSLEPTAPVCDLTWDALRV